MLAGLLATGGWQWPESSSASDALTDTHLVTYEAVVRAIGDAAVNGVDPAKASDTRNIFRIYLRDQTDDCRRAVAHVLGDLELAPSDGVFSELSRARARAFLQEEIQAASERTRPDAAESRSLDDYLTAAREDIQPGQTCDPERDCGSLSTAGRPVTASLVRQTFPEVTLRAYVARSAVTLAAMPSSSLHSETGPSPISV